MVKKIWSRNMFTKLINIILNFIYKKKSKKINKNKDPYIYK